MVSAIRQWAGNKWVRRISTVLAVLLVFLAVRAYQQRDLVIGRAPELAGVAVDGRSLVLGGDERATLVYFWATWCPVCRLEHGTIESIAADWPVITIALQSGTDAELRRYLKEHDLKPERGVGLSVARRTRHAHDCPDSTGSAGAVRGCRRGSERPDAGAGRARGAVARR